ncbi:hypothetical protein Tco_1347875, partial [Tanacetum coccineum]
MSNFEDSSFHNNNGRRIMSFEIVNYYPWEEIKSSNIDICRAFLKLCVAEDPIWEKITCELEEPFHNTHVDECVCCQVQHMMEENVYALRKEMQKIHASINNDLKGSIAVVDDIARLDLVMLVKISKVFTTASTKLLLLVNISTASENILIGSTKAIALPQDVPNTSDRRLIELENQFQCLMEAHFAPTQPTQVNKITSSCEICSGPYDTQYCMEDPEQAFVEYTSSRTDEAGVK